MTADDYKSWLKDRVRREITAEVRQETCEALYSTIQSILNHEVTMGELKSSVSERISMEIYHLCNAINDYQEIDHHIFLYVERLLKDMAKGWVTLNVREVKEKLQQIYGIDKKRPESQKFGNWLDNLLTEMVDHDERVRKYGKLLEVISCDDNHVLIKDNWQGKHFFVEISSKANGTLYCQEDASSTCLHVGYGLALPQVYKALIQKGFRPPEFYILTRVVDKTIDRLEGDDMKRRRKESRKQKSRLPSYDTDDKQQDYDKIKNRLVEPDA